MFAHLAKALRGKYEFFFFRMYVLFRPIDRHGFPDNIFQFCIVAGLANKKGRAKVIHPVDILLQGTGSKNNYGKVFKGFIRSYFLKALIAVFYRHIKVKENNIR